MFSILQINMIHCSLWADHACSQVHSVTACFECLKKKVKLYTHFVTFNLSQGIIKSVSAFSKYATLYVKHFNDTFNLHRFFTSRVGKKRSARNVKLRKSFCIYIPKKK